MSELRKYPRTPHLAGSRKQPGDEDLTDAPFSDVTGKHVVVEEKVDGANAAISFSAGGELLLQSRGHFLTGGPREKHFALFKTWAQTHRTAFERVLGDRYVLYGEWLLAKHTLFYDRLPHYFLEFDVLDRQTETHLSTASRRAMLRGTPVVSVPVLAEGSFERPKEIRDLVRTSLYRSDDWRTSLRAAAQVAGVPEERALGETDRSPLAEGLYLKVEEGDAVIGRYKWIRASFLTSVTDAGGHWLDRPIIRNGIEPGVDIFSIEEAERR